MPGGENSRPTARGKEGVHYDRVAVAFLDVVGYSALMGEDERATFDRWTQLKQSLLMAALKDHRGRYVKSTGDGLIATFVAANDAVAWATDVQRRARLRGEGLRMRISLNWGDVIVDRDGDIAGDCVNIAARLEHHALPGGVIVTGQLRDAIADSGRLDLQPLGELKLSNIRRKVSAFHLHSDARDVARTAPLPSAPRLPSIAVLPFASDDAEPYFCTGVVDDVIVSLSGVQELTVIARSSARAVGAQRGADPRELGETLGVDYLLSGVIQRAGGDIRLSFVLTETATGAVVSTERSTFPVQDLFSVQDQIVERVVARTTPQVRWSALQRALRKPPESFTAYEHLLRALEKVASLDRSDFEAARGHLDQAIAEDPNFAMPYAWSARWRTIRVGQGWSPDPAADNAVAADAARMAIRLDRRNALALATYGHVQAYMFGDYDTAIDYLDRAVAAGPNNAIARILRSGTLSFLGRGADARAEAQKALRLSPFDEQLFQFYGFMALACYADDDFEAAIRWAHRSLAENANYTHTLKVLIAASVADGRVAAAQQATEELMVREPSFRLRNYRERRAPFRRRRASTT
jgi:adenylate cyclase